ncbi:MAG: hypothetical protein BroJett030_22450 [Alphaproteobacteria bacterium]|nr:MAG: hypothetical protein BroJett030_22450 [Alphaproteobacteria bacterium]
MAVSFPFQPLRRTPSRRPETGQSAEQVATRLHMAALLGLLRRRDDHLLRDIGLTREELLGPARAFWSDWLRRKQPWQL